MLARLFGSQPPGAALLAAVGRDDVERVRALLAAGERTDVVDSRGLLPIHRAAAAGAADIVALLVRAGANPNAPSGKGGTWAGARPLHYAALYGKAEAAQLLLAKGAHIDETTDSGATPLHLAAWSGEARVLRTLLIAGADISKATAKWASPLHAAAAKGQVSRLVDVIHLACFCTPLGCVLLELWHSDDDVRREQGWHFLTHALNLKILAKGGAISLHLPAAFAGHALQAEAVHILLEAGPVVTAVDKDGNTPLHSVILGWEAHRAQSYMDCAEALLAAGVNPAALNNMGQSASSMCGSRRIRLPALEGPATVQQRTEESRYSGETTAWVAGRLEQVFCNACHLGSTSCPAGTLHSQGGAARASELNLTWTVLRPCWLFFAST